MDTRVLFAFVALATVVAAQLPFLTPIIKEVTAVGRNGTTGNYALVTLNEAGVVSSDFLIPESNYHDLYADTSAFFEICMLLQDRKNGTHIPSGRILLYNTKTKQLTNSTLGFGTFDYYSAVSYDSGIEAARFAALGVQHISILDSNNKTVTINNSTLVMLDERTGQIVRSYPLGNVYSQHLATDMALNLSVWAVNQTHPSYFEVTCAINTTTHVPFSPGACYNWSMPPQGATWPALNISHMHGWFTTGKVLAVVKELSGQWAGAHALYALDPLRFTASLVTYFSQDPHDGLDAAEFIEGSYYDKVSELYHTMWRAKKDRLILSANLDKTNAKPWELLDPPYVFPIPSSLGFASFDAVITERQYFSPPVNPPVESQGAAVVIGILVPIVILASAGAGFFLYRVYHGQGSYTVITST